MATIDVVKYFRRKQSNGFEAPTYLGAEQRFVGALPNSNNNNLEEQFLLGTDTYTEFYLDNEGNQVIEKSFKKDGADTDYYKLVSIIYAPSQQHNDDFYFDNDEIHLKDGDPAASYADGQLDFNDNSYITFNIIDGKTGISVLPNTFTASRLDSLYYIDNGGNSTLVAIKTTFNKTTVDGREIVKELVEDKLI